LPDTLYTVVCTDTAHELQWQCELLEHTWRSVEQPGELLRLVAAEPGEPLPVHTRMRVVRMPASNTHPRARDAYVPWNRLFSLDRWLHEERPEGTVLVLDPDMVFRDRLVLHAAPGRPVGQHWVDFGTGEALADPFGMAASRLQPVTWPMAIHTSDLAHLLPRWIERTFQSRQVLERWESDMFGLVLAASDLELTFSLQTTCAWLSWPEADVAGAPLIHYCQPVEDRDGRSVWCKRTYRPWDGAFEPDRARLDYCRDLLRIVRDYARERSTP
jgi:hypothetical protein